MTRTVPAAALRRRLALSSALGVSLVVIAQPAAAQETNTPMGPTVQSGVATFANGAAPLLPISTGDVDGTLDSLNVNLITNKSVIDWQAFDIRANKLVTFIGANGSSVLNRVTTGDVSQLAGTLNAPGVTVWLINTNGIAFGNGASINVGGLVASTLPLRDPDGDPNTDDDLNSFLTSNSARFQGAPNAAGAITTLAGVPAQINTGSGVLALVAPQINLTTTVNGNGAANAGDGPTVFAIATDVSLTTSPGGPLSVTLNAGTQITTSTIAATVTGDRVYALITPDAATNALLNMSGSTVTNASVDARGVVVLAGENLTATVARPGTDDTLATGNTATTGLGSSQMGTVNFAAAFGNPAAEPAGGAVTQRATGTLSAGAVTANGAITLAGGTGGAGFTALAGDGTKLVTSGAGINGQSIIGSGTVSLNAAVASPITITGRLGTSATDRVGALTVDGGSAFTIGTTGVTDGTTVASLTSAAIGQAPGAATGGLTAFGTINHSGAFTADATGAVALGDVASGAAFNVGAGTRASFGALSGAGSKTIVGGTPVGGVSVSAASIRGTGAVSLAGPMGAANAINVAGGIGAAGTPVASLAINGGATNTGSLFVSGAALMGQAGGLTSLKVTGTTTAGAMLSGTDGAQEFTGTVSTADVTAIASINGKVTAATLTAGTDTGAANRTLNVEGKSVSIGFAQAGSGANLVANGTVAGNRDITVGGGQAQDFIVQSGTLGTTTVSGTVTTAGGLLVRGGTAVSLTGGTHASGGLVTVDTIGANGVVTIASGVSVTADADNSGDLLTIGGSGTTQLLLTGSTLKAGGNGNGELRFLTATGDNLNDGAFRIGNVTAGTLSQQIGAGPLTAGINRSQDLAGTGPLAPTPVTFGNLTLSGVNSITSNYQLQTGSIAVGNNGPMPGNQQALTLTGGATVTVGGPITNITGTTGGVTATALQQVTIGTSNLAGALTLSTTDNFAANGVDYTSLAGNGAKTLTSAFGHVMGGAIAGTGAVTLSAGATAPITISGDVGTATAKAASLTVQRGGAVQLQGLFVTGATQLGVPTRLGSLLIAGAADTGSFSSLSTGLTQTQAITARTGGIGVDVSAGDAQFNGTLTTLATGTSIGVTASGAINGGVFDARRAVGLTSGGATTISGGFTRDTGTGTSDFVVTATGAATVSGDVSSQSVYTVRGSTVTLGAAAGTAVTQTAIGATTVQATGGTGPSGQITGRAGLTLVSNADNIAVEPLLIGGATTGNINFAADSALRANGDGTGEIRFGSANTSDTFTLGDVNAGTLTQSVNGGGIGNLDRLGAITFRDLTLRSATFVGSDQLITARAVTVGAGLVTLAGDLGVTVTGAIGNVTGGTGGLTLNGYAGASANGSTVPGAGVVPGTGAAGTVTVANSNLAGPLTLNGGTGGVVFQTLDGTGTRRITSGGAIGNPTAGAANLRGTGAVTVLGTTASVIGIDTVGTATTRVSALTIDGGQTVRLGTTGSTADNVYVSGLTSIGQTTASGALTVNGAVRTGGIISRTTNGTITGAILADQTASTDAAGSIALLSTAGSVTTGALSTVGTNTSISVTAQGAAASGLGDVTTGATNAVNAVTISATRDALTGNNSAPNGAINVSAGRNATTGGNEGGSVTVAANNDAATGDNLSGSFIAISAGRDASTLRDGASTSVLVSAGRNATINDPSQLGSYALTSFTVEAATVAAGMATVNGQIQATGAYSVVSGTNTVNGGVQLGGAAVQRGGSTVSIVANGGTITGGVGLLLTSGTGAITIGGTQTTGILLGGTTVSAGSNSFPGAIRNINLRTQNTNDPFVLGNVYGNALNGNAGATITNNLIDRTGNVTFGDIVIGEAGAANTIRTTGANTTLTIGTGAGMLGGAIFTGGNLTLGAYAPGSPETGTGVTTVNGLISNFNTTTGTVTVNGIRVDIDDVNLNNTLTINAGSGGAVVGRINHGNDAGSPTPVVINAATNAAVTTGAIGSVGATGAVASLTVNGGNQVTIGETGVTSRVTGATLVGQAPGAATATLTVLGTLDTGSVTSTTTGSTTLGTVTSAGAINFRTTGTGGTPASTGDILFTSLAGTGTKTLDAFRNVDVNGVSSTISSGGAVSLTAGNSITVTQIGADGGAGVASLSATAGNSIALGTDAAVDNVKTVGGATLTAQAGTLRIVGGASIGTDLTTSSAGNTGIDTARAGQLDASGAITVTAGSVNFGSFYAPRLIDVTSSSFITGGQVDGGAVQLRGGAASPVTIDLIGPVTPIASLTVNGGDLVTLGTAGSTNRVTGATLIGQAPGAATSRLTVLGTLDSGSVTSTTTGSTTLDMVTSAGAVSFTTTGTGGTPASTGDILFTALGGIGSKALNAFRTIDANGTTATISSGGAVALTAGTNIAVTQIGADGGTGVASLTATAGNSIALGANAAPDNLKTVGSAMLSAQAGTVRIVGGASLGRDLTTNSGGNTTIDAARAGQLAATGAITVTAGSVNFGSFYAPRLIDVASGTFIMGGLIDGGAVRLRAGTGSPVTVGRIGPVAPVTSLTVNGGGLVTLGTAGGTLRVAGDTAIGQSGTGAATGGLVVNGNVASGGAFTVTTTKATGTTGAVTLNSVDSAGPLSITTTGAAATVAGDLAITFTDLTGAGTKTLIAGAGLAGQPLAGIAGHSIDGAGAVSLTAAQGDNITLTGTVGAGTAVASLTIEGGRQVTLGTVGGPATVINSTGAVRVGQVTRSGTLSINGDVAGTATSFASRTAGATAVRNVTVAGAGTIGIVTEDAAANPAADVTFATLTANGAKTVTSASGIAGTSVLGTGAVTLSAAATKPITIAGTIGTAAAQAASLTINGGSAVSLGGTAGTTTVAVAGDIAVGQAPGATTGALTVTGNVVNGGAFRSTTTNGTTLADVTSGGLVSIATGAGNAGITAANIRTPAAVTLAAATANPITVTSIGATGAPVSALTVNGGSAVTIGAAGSTATNLVVTGATSIGQGTASGTLLVNGPLRTGSLTSTTSGNTTLGQVIADNAVQVTATGGNVSTGAVGGVGTAASGPITLAAGGSVGSGVLTSAGAVTVTAGTAATVAGGTSGGTGDFAVTAGGAAAIAGAVTAGGGYRVRGGSVMLGGAGVTQAARGLVDVTSTGGALTAATGLTLQSNSDGAGAEYLVLDATGGAIAFGGATLLGGTAAQRSDIGVLERTAGQTVTLGTVTGRSLAGVNAARSAFGTLSSAGDIVATGPVIVQQTLALTSTGGLISLQAVDVTGAGQGVTLTTTAPGGGAITANRLTTQGAVNVDARGAVAVTTSASGTSGTIRGTTVDLPSINVGAGALTVTSTAGLLRIGTGTAGATTLNATGPVEVTTSLTTSGATTITTSADAALKQVRVSAGALGVTAAGAVNGGGTTRADLAATGTGGNVTVQAGTAALLGPIAASDSGGTATLSAGTTLDANSIVAGGQVTATSTGATTIGTVQSRGSGIAVTGGTAAVTSADAAGALSIRSTAGALTLGTGKAGGTATLSANGTGGNLTVTGPLTATGAVTATAGATATLGQTNSGASVGVTAATIMAGATTAATTLTLTSTGSLQLASGQAGGDASFDAGGTATLGQVLAGSAAAITVRALDAAISGTQRAGRVTFVNRSPATQAMKLGDNLGTGGFALTAIEVNHVEAAQLTLDAGTGNVEIGALAFDADAGRTRVDVLTTGRIDVTGGVSGTAAGGNGTRAFRFGGTAANVADKADVIRVVSTPDAGGRLVFDGADLELRGARIGVGQAPGFLNPIGFGPTGTPLSPAAVGADYVGNPNSSLYNSTFGGEAYVAGATLVQARSLTVRFTDYALFQNTGTPGLNSGVALGTAASPSTPALVVQGPGGTGTNAFAIFGSINGVTGTASSVSGSAVIQISGVDQGNTRVNGCIAGSGAGCLTSTVSQPLLNVFDSSRLNIFRTADDLALPFDPVVGTNNEALFSGFGIIDSPVTGTECTEDTTNPACGQQREQGK